MRLSGLGIVLCAMAFGQAPADAPSFEVAVIRPSPDPTTGSSGISESKGRINAKNVTLKRCIRGAYAIPESEIIGGPKWIAEDRFYIQAKAAGPAGDDELMLMLRTLLADRFRLVMHHEQRTLSGYKLVVSKGGLRTRTSAPSDNSVGNLRRGRLDAKSYSMSQLVIKLAEVLHAPVVDATGMTGKFDFTLEWTPDDMQTKPALGEQRATGASDDVTAPSIFTAVQEQLGLKLEAGKIPADVLVIDSADKPSEN